LSAGNRYHPAVYRVNDPGKIGGVQGVMKPDEIIQVESRVVGCDGGGGALGHPLVYLKIGGDGEIVCPYCSRRFVLAEGAQQAAGH
jgi:uncharacterized Zn-finger protein